MEGSLATGDEIYQFLVRPVGYAVDPDTEQPFNSDPALWYLGTNEKFGELAVNENVMEWGFGESNWDRVLTFLHILNERNILTVAQYVSLISLVEEGMKAFDDMYQIADYLKAKRDGVQWVKKETKTKEILNRLLMASNSLWKPKGTRSSSRIAPSIRTTTTNNLFRSTSPHNIN